MVNVLLNKKERKKIQFIIIITFCLLFGLSKLLVCLFQILELGSLLVEIDSQLLNIWNDTRKNVREYLTCRTGQYLYLKYFFPVLKSGFKLKAKVSITKKKFPKIFVLLLSYIMF